MAKAAAPQDLQQLLSALVQPGALIELGVLLVAGLLSALIVRAVRGPHAPVRSVWFGRRLGDGLLFLLVMLVLVVIARVALDKYLEPAVFRLAIPILVTFAVVRLVLRVFDTSFPDAVWTRGFGRGLVWLGAVVVLLWITGVLPAVLAYLDQMRWKIGSVQISLRTLVEGTFTACVLLVLALWISSAVEKQLIKGTGDDLSMRMVAANLIRAVLLLVGAMLGLTSLGIDLTTLSVLGGALGVGIGFGLQKIAANYISGFVILAERSVRIGDMVKLEEFEGRITDIRTRFTVIRALDGRESIVPNEMFIVQRVENSSLAGSRVLVFTLVRVAYGTDVRALQPKLVALLLATPRVLDDPLPNAQIAELAADCMVLRLNFWISDPENGQGELRSNVHLAVLDLFEAEGVKIPPPQQVLHLRSGQDAAPLA